MDSVNDMEFDLSRPGRSRPGVVFTIAPLILLVVFLIPLPVKLLDALWICSFCLSGAVTIICIAAQSSSDLIGFIPMISGLTFLRLVAQAGTARHIIRDEPAGILLGLTGSALASGWPLAAVLICLLLALVIIFVVFISCQKITLAANGYLRQILPLKRMGSRDRSSDWRIIDDDQAGTNGLGVSFRKPVFLPI